MIKLITTLRRKNRSTLRRFKSSWAKISLRIHSIHARSPKVIRSISLNLLAIIFIAITVLPTFSVLIIQRIHHSRYTLSKAEISLIDSSSVDTKLIKQTDKAFTYNRADEASPHDIQKVLSIAGKTDATGKEPYSASLPKDPKEGISFGDSEGERTFKLIPTFNTSAGELDDGRVIYPSSSTQRQIYSFKKNGIKSDITLTKQPKANALNFSWRLDIGTDLDTRMLPDGSVGIYSSDPNLFGNVQVGDQKSQELIDKARSSGQKDTLVYVLPKPFISDSRGLKNYDDVGYNLSDNVLTLQARNLKNQLYPLTIDPTIVVTTTSDFLQKTGDTGNIDYGTANQIQRLAADAGSVGNTTQQTTAFPTARNAHSTIAYNGFLYIIGGQHTTNDTACNSVASVLCSDILFATINSNGSLSCPSGFTCTTGVFTSQASAFTTARSGHASVIYNGYLYIVGGFGGSYQNDIQYCPLNANGSVGTCTQQTSAFTTGRYGHTSVVYNGYLYIVGGVGISSSYQNDIQYCPLNANGSVGTCTQQTSAFTTARYGHTSVVYNGYLYIIGGYNGTTLQNDIQYCPLNANGSVGTCTQQTSAFTTARYNHTSVVYNGYLYIVGGDSGSSQNDIQYCPLNANGSVGTCTQQTSAFTTARSGHSSVVYNGYLYLVGGSTGATYYDDVQYLPIGTTIATPIQQTSAFTSARNDHTSIAYNGFLYIVGGTTGTVQNDVQYCPLNADGSVGACTQQTSAFTTARSGHTSVVYNGYLYIVGGTNGTNQNDIQYSWIDTSTGALCLPSNHATCTGTVFAQQTSAFTTARTGHTSVVYNGFLYIVGGNASGTAQNDIQYSWINASTGALCLPSNHGICSGTVFAQQTNAFATPRIDHTSEVYNGYLYIIGGFDSGRFNDVQHCPMNSDGSVGTCIQQTSAFTTVRSGHSSGIYNGHLYIAGGTTGGSDQNDIQYSWIDTSTGALCLPSNHATCTGTVFTQQTNAFTTIRNSHTSVIYNGYFYIVGGINASSGTRQNDIQYTQLGPPNGGEGATTQQTSAFTTARSGHTSVAYNGYLYIIGGFGGSYENDIQYSWIDTATGALCLPSNHATCTGTVFTQQTSAFTTARGYHTSVVYNGYLYIIGGFGGSYENDIQYSWIDTATGALCLPSNHATCTGTVFTQQTSAFTTARRYHASVVYNGYLYIVGGTNGTNQNDIQYSWIDTSTGALCLPSNHATCTGTVFTQQTSAFTTARSGHTSVVYNGYLYIVGGYNGTIYQNDIQYSWIDTSTGALCLPSNHATCTGTVFTQQTSAFTTARGYHTSVVYNGYLYVVGGYDGGAYLNDILYCPLNPNGSVGDCTQKTSAFTTTRREHASSVYNGYLYIAGGYNGSYQSDAQRIPVYTSSYKARYERTIDTGSGSNIINSFVINGSTKCSYTVFYKTAGSSGVYGSATTINNVYPGVSQTITSSSTRYVLFVVTLDDSTCGDNSYITDISLTYNAVPDSPTLLLPVSGSTGVSVLPEFRLGTADDSNDYIRYKIEVCSTSNCSSIVRTIDETSSQTGWSLQSQQSGTAYSSGATISQYAIHLYQPAGLSASTQYWWRAYAIDPGGNNTFSSASAISTFTTGLATPAQTNVGGGTTIYGGTTIGG